MLKHKQPNQNYHKNQHLKKRRKRVFKTTAGNSDLKNEKEIVQEENKK